MQLSIRALSLASSLAGRIPNVVAEPVARTLGSIASMASADQRKIVELNLQRVLGENLDPSDLARLTREVFRNYAMYWLDSLRISSVSTEALDLGLTCEGLEHIVDPQRRGQGVIAAIPHLGSWEAGARWLVEIQELHVVAAVEKLEPPELYDWFVNYRTKELGIDVVPVGPGAAAELAAALSSGALLTLLCDRDLTGEGIEVEFFGERTKLPAGPALLALRSGCPLVPLAVFYKNGKHRGVVLPPIDTERRGRLRDDVERVTADLARALEDLIRRDPTQWHILQPNWPSDFDALGLERPEWARAAGVDPGRNA